MWGRTVRSLGPSGWNTVSSCTDTVPGEMPLVLILTPLLFGLSFLWGMLGLGVAFIAIPVLGLFGFDLKDVISPGRCCSVDPASALEEVPRVD